MPIFVPGQPGHHPLLLLHGTGGSERDLLPIARFLDPAAPQLSIGGRLEENGQSRYFRHDVAGGFDQTDLARETDWLMTTLTAELAANGLSGSDVIAVGYSNGANIAAHAILTRPTPFAAGIFFHATTVAADSSGPNLAEVPLWLSYGDHDPFVPSADFATLVTRLRQRGAAPTIYHHPHGHQLTHSELAAARSWLQEGV
ncbi:MAG: dienelactone hydrolase family protein [Lactobacillus sp.]|nr:dienelactone hydrolase family protein [Lactobacillus sp.]MCI2033755.1 dienelactone hydrolase family protein [Lactobacillus sp.]